MVRAGDIARQLSAQAESVARHLLPLGKLKGNEWCNVGGEGGESFKVNVRTGLWKDHGSTERGGDLLDLWARERCGGDKAQAMREAAEWLGIDTTPAKVKRAASARRATNAAPAPDLRAIPGGRVDPDAGVDPFPEAHPTRGRPAARWIYPDANGAPVLAVYRFDLLDGGKDCLTFTLQPKGWCGGGGGELPNPRPLYRRDELERHADEPVVLVEGEKAADAVADAGYLATTTHGGANAAGKADLSPLAGRRVILWRDNDRAGEQYIDQVAELLRDAGATDLRRVDIPAGAPDAWDAADADVDQVRELIDAAAPMPDPDAAESLGFTGGDLLALLKRPPTPPVQPAIPVPGHFTLYVGSSFAGKSSLVLWLAMARAVGIAPWHGAPAFLRGRVLVYSLDESPEQVMRRIQNLAAYHTGAADLEAIAANLVIIGPDRDVDPEKLDALRFDARGIAKCRRYLLQARDAGDPFCELYVDAYADFLPIDAKENDNETGSRIGSAMERLAVETGTAVCVLHHAGKAQGLAGVELDVRDIGRGASALAAKARTIFAIAEDSGIGRHVRRIRTRTNLNRTPPDAVFQVCATDAKGTELNYWRPYDPTEEHGPKDYIDAGEEITSGELTRRIAANRDGVDQNAEPSQAVKSLAKTLREEWAKRGLVEVTAGPRNSKMVRLK